MWVDELVLRLKRYLFQICDGLLIQASLLSTESPRGLAYSALDDQGEVRRSFLEDSSIDELAPPGLPTGAAKKLWTLLALKMDSS